MNLYEVLRRPVDTEKSRHQNSKLHQYVFEVARDATKTQIREAVQTLFDVEVEKVRVIVVPAKRGRRGRTGRRIAVRNPEYTKAVVTLRADQTIDVFEGVR